MWLSIPFLSSPKTLSTLSILKNKTMKNKKGLGLKYKILKSKGLNIGKLRF
jgi:hypothetical protein